MKQHELNKLSLEVIGEHSSITLARAEGEGLHIGSDVYIKVSEINKAENVVRLAVHAPANVWVKRDNRVLAWVLNALGTMSINGAVTAVRKRLAKPRPVNKKSSDAPKRAEELADV